MRKGFVVVGGYPLPEIGGSTRDKGKGVVDERSVEGRQYRGDKGCWWGQGERGEEERAQLGSMALPCAVCGAKTM